MNAGLNCLLPMLSLLSMIRFCLSVSVEIMLKRGKKQDKPEKKGEVTLFQGFTCMHCCSCEARLKTKKHFNIWSDIRCTICLSLKLFQRLTGIVCSCLLACMFFENATYTILRDMWSVTSCQKSYRELWQLYQHGYDLSSFQSLSNGTMAPFSVITLEWDNVNGFYSLT